MNLFTKKKKKGFTIVELVIVIAVIGVLAAILIPTFVGLVNKANVAADGTLVRELNNAIALDLAEKGETKHETMTDALEATKEYGFDVTRISTKASKNKILWDSVHGVFCYLKEDAPKVEYVPGSVEEGKELKAGDYRLWIISSTVDETYSTYLYKATETTFTTTKGLDVGNENVTAVTYNGGTNAQDVVIRTNGGTLTVNATNDTVSHYGFATVVNVNDVDDNCYNENGTVGRLIYSDNDGKIYFGNTAVVYCYMNTSTDTAANAEFSGVKAANAIVYTYVDSGEDEAKGYAAADNKENVTVTDGIVEISTCFNHNEDYDIIYIGDDIYIICKCCGAFSKISTDANGTTTVESSEGIGTENQEHETNEFIAKNNSSLPIINAVATIGYTKYYSTLAAAVTDAKDGDTITMLKDIEVTANQQIAKDLSLDLNGKKITYTNDSANAYIFSVGVHKFAVLDSSKNGSGLITTTVSAAKKTIYGIGSQSGSIIEFKGGNISAVKYGFVVNAGATLNVSDGTVESAASAVWLYGGTSNIKGGTFRAPISIKMGQIGSVLNVYGGNINGGTSGYGINATKTNTTINVYGGEITGGYAICFTGAGTANIENGHIYGDSVALYTNAASTINVNGGLIEGVQQGISINKNTSILNVNGGEIKSPYIGIYNLGIATILDGTISGDEYGVYSYTGSSLTMENGVVKSLQNGIYNVNGTINMSGGTVIVSGIETKKDSYSIYSTGATSVSGTANIQNLNPYQEEPKLDDNGEVVLDENGKAKLNTYIPYGIFSNGTSDNKANLTINGGSISAQDGFALTLSHTDAIITNGTLSGANAIVSSTYDSTCTISDGMFNATGSQVCYAQNGIFTISGGIFTGSGSSNPDYASQPYRFTLNCLDDNRITKEPTEDYPHPNAWFYVTGGSFYQFNPSNDLSEGANTCFTPDGYHTEYNEETGYYTVVENN